MDALTFLLVKDGIVVNAVVSSNPPDDQWLLDCHSEYDAVVDVSGVNEPTPWIGWLYDSTTGEFSHPEEVLP